jgi:hypothetical protein
VRGDQRNRSETQRQKRSKEPIRDTTSEEIKGTDQRRNIRRKSKEPIRDAPSEEIKGTDQRRNVRRKSKEPIRDATSEEIKGTDQRHNVRSRPKEPIRDATSEEIKGTDQRSNVRSRPKEPIRDATSGGDQRNRYLNMEKKHLFLDIPSANVETLVPTLYQCVQTRSIKVFQKFVGLS